METIVIIIVYFVVLGVYGFSTWLSSLNYKNRNAKIPEEVKDVYDELEYKKWLNYTMERFKYSKIVSAIDTIIIILFLVLGVFVLIDETAKLLFTNSSLQILAFLGIYHLISTILWLYPSYYSTFVIEEKSSAGPGLKFSSVAMIFL